MLPTLFLLCLLGPQNPYETLRPTFSLLDSVFAPTFFLKRYSAVRYNSILYFLGLTSYITFLLCFAHRPHVYLLYHHASLHVLCCSWVLNVMTALKKLTLNLSTKKWTFYRIVLPCGNLMLLPIQLIPYQYWKTWTIDNNHEILAQGRVDHVHKLRPDLLHAHGSPIFNHLSMMAGRWSLKVMIWN